MLRTHAAGSLRSTDAGQKVTLAGWVARRRDHGGVIFIDLRDASGVAQVVFREGDVLAQAHRLRAEFCIAVDGVVEVRPEGNENPEIPTGEIEVNATSLTGRHGPEPEDLGWSLLESGAGKLVASDGHRTTRPAHLDDAHALAQQRLGDRALSLFDGTALGVTPSRTASRAASTGA